MYDFIKHDSSDMARDFSKRSVELDLINIYFFNDNSKAYEERIKENAVISTDSLVAHYIVAKLTTSIFSKLSLGFDYHISEKGFGNKPYFLGLSQRAGNEFKMKLNLVLV